MIIDKTYKGDTLDTLIRLDSGKTMLASEFFDEDDPSFDYTLGQRVDGHEPARNNALPTCCGALKPG